MLTLYNTLTGKKEPWQTIHPHHARLYACGVTVYDDCHIGHARVMLVFDMVVRYLRTCGYQVTYVRNITDIDDKIIQRAQQNGEPWQQLVDRMISHLKRDEKALHITPPSHEPRATDYIDGMIKLIEELLATGHAYVAANGDVYYAVKQFANYGQLSHRQLNELRVGVRINPSEVKREALDFVLWKLAKPNEPHWPSPWGEGRPGWHSECAVMARQLLGQPFDIHGGGMDLKFPHHENEIAQAEAVCSQTFAKTWMHVGLVQVNGEKMAKSLGNFTTIQQALGSHHPETLRYFMLASHYRSPVNYSESNLQQAKQALTTLYNAIRDIPIDTHTSSHANSYTLCKDDDQSSNTVVARYEQQFKQKMDDDCNTPEALAILFDLARTINRLHSQQQPAQAELLAHLLRQLGGVLGILQCKPDDFLQGNTASIDTAAIEQLIQARQHARQQKNWQRADEIRDQLNQMGIVIEDKAGQSSWRKR